MTKTEKKLAELERAALAKISPDAEIAAMSREDRNKLKFETFKQLAMTDRPMVEKALLETDPRYTPAEAKTRIAELEQRELELSTPEQLHKKIKMILEHLYPGKTELEALAEHSNIIIHSEEVSQ